jgi:glycosyltransferase involved in cell wall biosynthesis
LTGDDLATAMASADILLYPSLTEAFSNVTLEAMASGLAVVAADVPIQRDLVTEEAGRLSPPNDAAAFADAIVRLASDAQLRHRLGAGGRAESARYTWADVFARGVAVYTEALALRSIGRAARNDPRADVAQRTYVTTPG